MASQKKKIDLTFDLLNDVNLLLREDTQPDTIKAGEMVLDAIECPGRFTSKPKAMMFLTGFYKKLLNEDMYLECATLLFGRFKFDARPFFARKIWHKIKESNKLIILGASSVSKCLGGDVPVLMFNGTIKKAKNVKIGDILMGDDNRPRSVLHVNKGLGKLYKINPQRGESWTCNSNHILSLKCAYNKWNGGGRRERNTISSTYTKGRIIDISIEEYLGKSKEFKKHFKQFHIPIDFPDQAIPFNPKIYGLWIGDGTRGVPALTSAEQCIEDCWCNYFLSIGYRISYSKKKGNCRAIFARTKKHGQKNEFTEFIKTSVINGEKRILPEYLINSRKNRLELLSGLIDSDGHISSGSSLAFTTIYEGLKNDVVFLCRSLGYGVTWKRYYVKYKDGYNPYFDIHIGGYFDDLPVLRKTPKKRTRDGFSEMPFTIEEIPDGQYYGFTVDGNSRFLLGDFTVTHNSFTAGTMEVLDYIRDPEHTKIRVAAPNKEHLQTNLFGHMIDLVRESAIPLKLHTTELFIGLNPNKRDYSISGITFPQDDTKASGRFKGFKAGQRGYDHPQFGTQGRARLLLDEGSTIPDGVYLDLPSIIASMENEYTVKIIICANPEEAALTKKLGEFSEPENGWETVDVDEDFEWHSKKDFNVLRLDGEQCENIIEDKIIFPGLLTPNGYKTIQGLGHSSYMTFGRGMFPLTGSKTTVISPAMLHSNIARLVYPNGSVRIASIDAAKENDRTIITTAQWGQATGTENLSGEKVKFPSPRWMAQIEQQFLVEANENVLEIAREIIRLLQGMNVSPQFTGLDATSFGSGIYSFLTEEFGDVLGLEWGESASEKKVFAEDKKLPKDLYSRLSDEMWYATSRWISNGTMKFMPTLDANELFHELSTRRVHQGVTVGRKARVEQKKEWKSRNGNKSPDRGDSLVQIQQIIRVRDTNIPGLIKDRQHVIKIDEGNMPRNVATARNLLHSIRNKH